MNRSSVGMVTPVLNGARWLDGMLASVRAQTYARWQLLVVDDGSTDDTVEIATAHAAADERIRVVAGTGVRRGAPKVRAHGRGLLPTDCAYLYFPDADDELEPELLDRLVSRLSGRPDAVAAFCRYRRIDEAGRPLAEEPPPRIVMTDRWSRALRDDESETPFESIYGWAAPAMEPVTMFRAEAYDHSGGWGAWPTQGGESVDLLCRMLRDGPVLFEPSPLYRYRKHSGQHSRDQERLAAAARGLRERWRERAISDRGLSVLVGRAEFFVDHRLEPRWGVSGAMRRARRGDLWGASRFLLGALRRYRWRAPVTPAVSPANSTRAGGGA